MNIQKVFNNFNRVFNIEKKLNKSRFQSFFTNSESKAHSKCNNNKYNKFGLHNTNKR